MLARLTFQGRMIGSIFERGGNDSFYRVSALKSDRKGFYKIGIIKEKPIFVQTVIEDPGSEGAKIE